MRILHIVPTYLPATRYGGPIYSVHGLCAALADRGHDVHVYTTNVDGDADSNVPIGHAVDLDGVAVHYFRSKYLRRLYWSPGMGAALKDSVARYDIVHIHSVFLWPTLAAARAAHRAGVPYVIAPRGMLVKELIARRNRHLKTAWIRLFERRNLEQATAIHVTSDSEAVELDRLGFKLPIVFNIPNGVAIPAPLDGNNQPEPTTSAPRQILYLGRLSWKKGLDRLVRAMVHLPDANLVIAGNDEENYRHIVERMVRDCGIEDRVRFLGAVGSEEKTQLFTTSSVLVLPSYNENFGNVVLEALAHGCPVVVTPEVGLSHILSSNNIGIVSSGEPEALAGSVGTLIRNDRLRREMGLRGSQVVSRLYNWRAVARSMEQRYLMLTEGMMSSDGIKAA